jgi:hypothetical protein
LLKFPFISQEGLNPFADVIYDLAERLSTELLQTFEKLPGRKGGRRGEFHPGQCLEIIHEVDDFVCKRYDLSEEETTFVKNYDSHLRKPENCPNSNPN